MNRTLSALLLTALLIAVPVQAAADGTMYWTDSNNSGGAIAKVFRANLDGTSVEPLVTPPGLNPRFIALDVKVDKMYWTDIGRIDRANLDGTGIVTLVNGLSGPMGIALDVAGEKIYWTNGGVDQKVQRANLDGSGVEDLVTGLGDPRGLALDLVRRKMYWTDTDTNKIQRANLDGSGVEDLVTGQSFPQSIALDVAGGKMYWSDSGAIRRANLDGSSLQDLLGVDGNPLGIALDLAERTMYWTDTGTNKIRRANLDGSGVEDLVTAGLDTPWGIALDMPLICDVELSYVGGLLTLDFEIGATTPTIWINLLVSVFGVIPLSTTPIPAIDPPISFPVGLPFPNIGTVGVLTMLISDSTPICMDFDTVNTGGVGTSRE